MKILSYKFIFSFFYTVINQIVLLLQNTLFYSVTKNIISEKLRLSGFSIKHRSSSTNSSMHQAGITAKIHVRIPRPICTIMLAIFR